MEKFGSYDLIRIRLDDVEHEFDDEGNLEIKVPTEPTFNLAKEVYKTVKDNVPAAVSDQEIDEATDEMLSAFYIWQRMNWLKKRVR